MPTTQCLLGIDLGTSSVKSVVVSIAGDLLSTSVAEYPILRPEPGYAEQDPEAWWQAVCYATQDAVQNAGDSIEVAAIALSGQMHGTVLLDAKGKALAPAVIWPDQRSARQVNEITEAFGLQQLTALTGSPVATGFQAATLLWIAQEWPDLWQKVDIVLLPKDFVRWRMTGEYATDPSDGSGTLLFDVKLRSWSKQLLEVVGLDPAQLPPVKRATERAGILSNTAASQMGLVGGIPVVTGAADTACSALGAGAVDAGTLLLTLSSGGQLVQIVEDVSIDGQGRIHTFCNVLEPDEGPGWYQMGAILSAGLALRWLRDEVFALPEEGAYEYITAQASYAPTGANHLLFLPYLSGERTPHLNPGARGAFLGVTAQHGRPELSRAVLEGVVFACYDAYSVLAELGSSGKDVVLAGGGARSTLWRSIVADVFGLPVRPLAVPSQSAMGAAILAGAGIGLFGPAETARAWARYESTVEPDADRHGRYAELFEIFQDAYQHNVGLFTRLNSWQ